MKFIYLIPLLFIFSSCLVGNTKCCDHVSTYIISKGLYIERYRTFCAGVFGELTDCYITDSSSFRQKIGSYDEHESFYADIHGNEIVSYNFEERLISDTIERKTIAKKDLLKYHNNAKNCLSTSTVFGKNNIECDNDFYEASSYKTDEGYYMTQVQYHCGSNYSNAVFYTDSVQFCVFIGVYIPGSFENNYSVRRNNDNFEFYNITERRKIDTVRVQTYLLTDLKKGKLIDVCPNAASQ